MSFPFFDRNRLVEKGIVKKKVRKIEKRTSTQFVDPKITDNGNQESVSRFQTSSQVVDSPNHHPYRDENKWSDSRNSFNRGFPSNTYVNTTKERKPISSKRNGFVGKDSSSYLNYSSPSPVSCVNKRSSFSESSRVLKNSSQKSRSSQRAFDQILPVSTPKRQSKGGKLSFLLANVIREKQYQTTVSRLLSFSGDEYFEQQEYSVDSAALRSSYSAWGTQVIQISDLTSIAVREREGPIIRQTAVPASYQPKQVFRLVSSPVKIDSIDGVSIVGGYVKI